MVARYRTASFRKHPVHVARVASLDRHVWGVSNVVCFTTDQRNVSWRDIGLCMRWSGKVRPRGGSVVVVDCDHLRGGMGLTGQYEAGSEFGWVECKVLLH